MILERAQGVITSAEIADLFTNYREGEQLEDDEAETLRKLKKSRNAASTRLKRLRRRGKIKHVGVIPEDYGGRPRHAYSVRRVKSDWLLHNYQLTWVRLMYWDEEWQYGDKDHLADARMTVEVEPGRTELFYVEYETGSRTELDRLKKRMDAYLSCRSYVLWIGQDDEHVQKLAEAGKAIGEVAFFGTLCDILEDPYGVIWRDIKGRRVPLRKGASNIGGL